MSGSDDRELLFGLLAFQTDFLPRERFLEAMHVWAADKSRPFALVLRERDFLDDDTLTLLSSLTDRHLELHERDPIKSLAEFNGLVETDRAVAKREESDVAAVPETIAIVTAPSPPSSYLGDEAAAGVSRRSSRDGMRYRRLRSHAKGGLGEVFVAEDLELNREVALKEIHDRHADDLSARARFLAEAEITAGLEHPGIVPVHGLGLYPDGRPYYAMRFVRGSSLAEAIRDYHVERQFRKSPSERDFPLRKLLRRFLDVCDAAAYAHSRSVLHRDIKPGNILVGRYGETIVVDWGLAKTLGADAYSNSQPSTIQDEPETPLVPSCPGSGTTTMPGAAVGTPAYMSPEQAAGSASEVGPASDVYSLGATLYHMLTGHPAFEGGDIPAILARVRSGTFRKPREVNPKIHRGLEAICLKAMALRPADRYQSPLELGADLEHWLADEPVSALRDTRFEGASRWIRRHRAAARVSMIALFIVTGVSVASAVVVSDWHARVRDALLEQQRANDIANLARRAERTAKYAEAEAKRVAEANFDRARSVVADYLETVATNPVLLTRPGLRPLRVELLEKSRTYYEEFLAQDPAKSSRAETVAEAYARLGDAAREVGRSDEAIASYRNAADRYEALAQLRPGAVWQREAAAVFNNLGVLLRASGRADEAEACLAKAFVLRNRLLAEAPSDERRRDALADVLENRATLWASQGRMNEARDAYLRAIDLRRELASENPKAPEYRRHLANSLGELGKFFTRAGNSAEAERCFAEADSIREKLASDHLGEPGGGSETVSR